MLWHVSVHHSFLWPNNTPFCRYNHIFKIHQLMGSFPLWVMLPKYLYTFLYEYIFSFLGYILMSEIAGSYEAVCLTLEALSHTVCQSSSIVLRPHQQYVRFQFLHMLSRHLFFSYQLPLPDIHTAFIYYCLLFPVDSELWESELVAQQPLRGLAQS